MSVCLYALNKSTLKRSLLENYYFWCYAPEMLMFRDLEARDFRLKAFDLSFWLMPFGSTSLGIMAPTLFSFVTTPVYDNHMERKGQQESKWV